MSLFYKMRSLISGILPISALFISIFDDYTPPTSYIIVGSLLCIFGISLRLWGFNYIGHFITSSEPLASELITCGPFSYVRHPIYTATFLIVIGLISSLGPTFLIATILSSMIPYYMILAHYEEQRLVQIVPAYVEYKKRVPMFIPSTKKRISSKQSPTLISKHGIIGFVKAVLRYELATLGTLLIVLINVLHTRWLL